MYNFTKIKNNQNIEISLHPCLSWSSIRHTDMQLKITQLSQSGHLLIIAKLCWTI